MKKKNNWVDDDFFGEIPLQIFLPSTISLREGAKPAPKTNGAPMAQSVQNAQASTHANAPGATAPNAGKIMSFSIKDTMQKKVEVEVKKAEETACVSEERETFSQDMLVKVWNNYLQYAKEKPVLQQTIQQCKPVLGTDFRIMLAVYNSSQEEIVMDERIRLVNYLRKELHNGAVELEIRICDAESNVKSYTNKELFVKMLEHNPSLSKLTKELNLELS